MKISVIIPVYNSEKYLEKCLDSVLAQTYDNWEVIAMDDGSKDNSFSILEKYAQEDSRFYVETKENEGPGLTRNRALDKATGDFIVFIDSDDYIECNYFELLVKKYENTRADVIFIDIIQESTDGNLIRKERMSRFKDLNRVDMIGCQMTGYMPWGAVRKAVSRALIREKCSRFTDDIVGEEAIYSFDILNNANRVEFINKYLYHYINRPGSQSKNQTGDWEITLNKIKNHLITNSLICLYERHLSSFAFTVLILWLLRNANKHNVFTLHRIFNNKIREFKDNYGWTAEIRYLRKEVWPLLFLCNLGLSIFLILAAKVYSFNRD